MKTGLTICVNVPVYNEDPELLEQVLTSLFAQSRRPNHVEVVDDGSIVDYSGLRARSLQRAPAGMTFTWVRTENRGKRHAQMETFATAAEDILITMDSDTVLGAASHRCCGTCPHFEQAPKSLDSIRGSRRHDLATDPA